MSNAIRRVAWNRCTAEACSCGCLSLQTCRLLNPDDELAEYGPGPRRLVDDEPF